MRIESSTVPIGTPRIVGPLYVTGAVALVEFAMFLSVSAAAASRAAVSVCAATVFDASVTVAKFAAFSASIDLTLKSGRSVAVAVLYSLPCHVNVLPGPSNSRACANASLNLGALAIEFNLSSLTA